jgi:AraC-like DNA-binding protein
MDELEIIYENETCLYSGEMLVVVPPGVKHAQRRTPNYKGHGSPTIQLTMKKIPVTSDISLFDILSKLFDNGYARKCPKRVSEIMASFDPDDQNTIADDRIAISLALHELLAIIIKSATEETKFKPAKKISDSNATRAYKIHMILSNCFRDDISVEYIAKKLGLSTRQVTRIIKSVYGKTFKEILVERRMKRAAKELIETDKNITEISSSVGYNASKGFYNAFKEFFGCLPTEYRKANKSHDNT